MVTRSNVRLGLTGAILLLLLGAFSGCGDGAVLGVGESTQDQGGECVWIEGVIHCSPDL